MRLALSTVVLFAIALLTPDARALNCALPTTINCGAQISGSSFSMSVGLSNYSCLPYNEATEVSYLLVVTSETDVTVRLTPTGAAWNPVLALLPAALGVLFAIIAWYRRGSSWPTAGRVRSYGRMGTGDR